LSLIGFVDIESKLIRNGCIVAEPSTVIDNGALCFTADFLDHVIGRRTRDVIDKRVCGATGENRRQNYNDKTMNEAHYTSSTTQLLCRVFLR
jgi:hypothetical protein